MPRYHHIEAQSRHWGIRIKLVKNKLLDLRSLFWRHHPDLNWGIKLLQSFALPLGYGATLYFCTLLAYFDVTGARDEIFASGSHRRALLPSTSRKLPLCGQPNSRMSRSTLISVRCSRTSMSLERETRFELATFALARQRSTTEPLSHILLVETIGLEPMTPCL